MKNNETLSEESKRMIVMEVLSGKYTKEQARRLYGIKSKSGILEWMRIFAGKPGKAHGLDPLPILKDVSNSPEDVLKLKARITQLEEELKLSKLKGKAFQIMVEIAREDYNLDLEKKSGAKQSNNSKKLNLKQGSNNFVACLAKQNKLITKDYQQAQNRDLKKEW